MITEYTAKHEVPALKREFVARWKLSKAGVWQTRARGTRWVLYLNGENGTTSGVKIWEYRPESGEHYPPIKARTPEDALKRATWQMLVKPALEKKQG